MRLNNLSYRYEKQQVLEKVSFQISEKDFFVLFGADDAGKTTLIHLIMGFDPHYQGEIIWDAEAPKVIRFVPDDIIWEKAMTVRRYMRFAQKAALEYDEELQGLLCEKFSVPLDSPLLTLTYQENKMAQIITALCAKPNFLILDEPLNFLDDETYCEVLELLKEENKRGMGILLVTEKYLDARGCGDYYAYLKEGEVIASGKVPEQDYRKKIITVTGGRQEKLLSMMDKVVEMGGEKVAYLYQGNMEELPRILYEARGRDFTVEELTLEEEIEMNFSRWEN